MKIKWIVLAVFTILLFGRVNSQQATLQEEQDFRFALQLQEKQLYDLAALQFEEFARKYPVSSKAPLALFSSAQNYEKADSLARAAELYNKLLFAYPQSDIIAQSQFSFAQLLEKNGEFLKAALTFERIKILDPKSELVPDAQLRAAENFLTAGQEQKAFDAAAFVLEKHRTHPARLRSYFVIARVYEARGDYAQAIAYLDRMLGDRIEDGLAAQGYARKAQLLARMGRYAQSDSVLVTLVNGNYSGPVTMTAAVKLAQSYIAQGEYEEAENLARQIVGKENSVAAPDLYNALGDACFLQKKWQEAKLAYNKALQEGGGETSLSWFRLGFVAKIAGDYAQAQSWFFKASSDSAAGPALQLYGAMEYAEAAARNGQGVEAIRYLLDLAAKVDVRQRSKIYLTVARIQNDFLNDISGAQKSYAAILTTDPTGALADDAQYLYAQSFDDLGDSKTALAEYRRYALYYPAGDFYQQAIESANRLAFYVPEKEIEDADDYGLDSASLPSQGRVLYQLARHYAYVVRDFPRALDMLAQLKSLGDEQINVDQLDYDAAMCHFALYLTALHEGEPIKAAEHARALSSLADQLAARQSDPALADQVCYWAALAGLSDVSGEDRLVMLQDRIAQITRKDSLKNELYLHLVQEIMPAEPDSADSSVTRAMQLLDQVAEAGTSDQKVKARYQKAVLLKELALEDSAATVLEEITEKRTPVQALAQMLLAMLYEQRGDLEAAARLYGEIVSAHYYSHWAKKATVRLASVLIKQEKFKAAQAVIKELKQQGAPPELRFFYPDELDEESLWLWADIARQLYSPTEAISALQNYLELGMKAPHAAEAFYAIGELAEELGKEDMALGYFQECALRFAADSIGQKALIRSSDLYFNRGEYEKALQMYKDMRSQLSGEAQKEAFSQQIICEYRLGRLNAAKEHVNEFKKAYDDRNAEARFLYEQGSYQMAQKNLSQAEKIFKSLSGKYDDVPEGARGELGLARLYVAQTKTEDALKRLTKIPQEYDDPDIVATAYLNLADFYYENRALENCITAGRKVLELQKSGTMRAQALDLLINAYDDLGLRDQAIAYQREYLRLFPHTRDALDRRIRIGTFLYYLKEYDRAIEQLTELAPIVPADQEARVRFWIAESYAAAGFTERAIVEYLKVRYQCKQTRLPFGVTALYKAGEGYKKLKNYAKAREMFELVVKERGTTDDFGRAALKKIEEINDILEQTS